MGSSIRWTRFTSTTRITGTVSSGIAIEISSECGQTTTSRRSNIRARKGVVIATGGHTGNVAFRRMFDPRLTDEYQVAGEPWTKQNADGETLAMAIGASLWATSNQSNDGGRAVTKTRHIGVRYG